MAQSRVSWVLLFFCCPCLLSGDGVFSFEGDILSPNQTIVDGDTLSTANGTFELGFFSPGGSKNRYLGIWYTHNSDAVVWVANRVNPIPDRGGSLTMEETGNLLILNKAKGVIWSSNLTTPLVTPVAQLLESGNFVLKGISTSSSSADGGTIVWQSFDYPTDTLLPGMKMGWNLKTGRETYLISWHSLDDPSPGMFTYKVQRRSLPQLVMASGSVEKYRTGPWKGFFFDGLPGYKQYTIFKLMMDINEDEIYYSFTPGDNNILIRMTLKESGSLQRYVRHQQDNKWTPIYWSPFDLCDNYAQCGFNGICSANNMSPCDCLKGFRRILGSGDLDQTLWSSATKCVRRTALNCSNNEGFLRIENVRLPDMINVTWNQSMDTRECELKCLKNCSCSAYANLNIDGTGKGCMMWFGDLVDVKFQPLSNIDKQDLYVRVSHSELVHSSNKKIIWIVLSVLLVFILVFIITFCCIRIRKRLKGRQNCMDDTEVPLLDFSVVDRATGGFAEENVIGEGGFGVVYKGKLSGGQDVAVKRLSKFTGQGIEEFRNEVTLIGKLQHRNLVSLQGMCIRGEERMLIYEYMPNKSLDYFLFDTNDTTAMAWNERFNIVMGIARGLLYLHQDSKLHVVHRDLKAANILLDSNMNPKISDFGIARIFDDAANQERTKRVMGTYGYMSPEYATDGRFSTKSDVFSFGVLILELVSSRKNRGFYHSKHSQNLLGHAWLLWIEEKPLELLDPNLKTISTSEALRCIHVGLLCSQRHPTDRPDMSTVVFMLANEGIRLPPPKQPGYFIEADSSTTTSSVEIDIEAHAITNSSITKLECR